MTFVSGGAVLPADLNQVRWVSRCHDLVQLPIARPYLLLGLNQTVIMAFGMLVITALVGTRGLEANTLKA